MLAVLAVAGLVVVIFIGPSLVGTASVVDVSDLDCAETREGSLVCVDTDKRGFSLSPATLTANSGTNLAVGSVARFTYSQSVIYNCPVDPWDWNTAQVYIFAEGVNDRYADDAFVQVGGDGGRIECGDILASSFYYDTRILAAGDYRMCVDLRSQTGGTLTKADCIEFSLYSSVSTVIASPMPDTGKTPQTYTPPPQYVDSGPSAPPQIFIIQAPSDDSGGGFNWALIIGIVVIVLALLMFPITRAFLRRLIPV